MDKPIQELLRYGICFAKAVLVDSAQRVFGMAFGPVLERSITKKICKIFMIVTLSLTAPGCADPVTLISMGVLGGTLGGRTTKEPAKSKGGVDPSFGSLFGSALMAPFAHIMALPVEVMIAVFNSLAEVKLNLCPARSTAFRSYNTGTPGRIPPMVFDAYFERVERIKCDGTRNEANSYERLKSSNRQLVTLEPPQEQGALDLKGYQFEVFSPDSCDYVSGSVVEAIDESAPSFNNNPVHVNARGVIKIRFSLSGHVGGASDSFWLRGGKNQIYYRFVKRVPEGCVVQATTPAPQSPSTEPQQPVCTEFDAKNGVVHVDVSINKKSPVTIKQEQEQNCTN